MKLEYIKFNLPTAEMLMSQYGVSMLAFIQNSKDDTLNLYKYLCNAEDRRKRFKEEWNAEELVHEVKVLEMFLPFSNQSEGDLRKGLQKEINDFCKSYLHSFLLGHKRNVKDHICKYLNTYSNCLDTIYSISQDYVTCSELRDYTIKNFVRDITLALSLKDVEVRVKEFNILPIFEKCLLNYGKCNLVVCSLGSSNNATIYNVSDILTEENIQNLVKGLEKFLNNSSLSDRNDPANFIYLSIFKHLHQSVSELLDAAKSSNAEPFIPELENLKALYSEKLNQLDTGIIMFDFKKALSLAENKSFNTDEFDTECLGPTLSLRIFRLNMEQASEYSPTDKCPIELKPFHEILNNWDKVKEVYTALKELYTEEGDRVMDIIFNYIMKHSLYLTLDMTNLFKDKVSKVQDYLPSDYFCNEHDIKADIIEQVEYNYSPYWEEFLGTDYKSGFQEDYWAFVRYVKNLVEGNEVCCEDDPDSIDDWEPTPMFIHLKKNLKGSMIKDMITMTTQLLISTKISDFYDYDEDRYTEDKTFQREHPEDYKAGVRGYCSELYFSIYKEATKAFNKVLELLPKVPDEEVKDHLSLLLKPYTDTLNSRQKDDTIKSF